MLNMFAVQLTVTNRPQRLTGARRSAWPIGLPGAGRPKGIGETGECGKGKGKAKGKAKGKGKGKAKDDDSESDSILSPSSAKGKGKEEEAEEDEGGASSKRGTASGGVATVNNNNKTKLQVASSTGFLTEFVTLRAQASCFRQLDLTVHNVLTYTDEGRKRSAGASKDSGEPGREVLNSDE